MNPNDLLKQYFKQKISANEHEFVVPSFFEGQQGNCHPEKGPAVCFHCHKTVGKMQWKIYLIRFSQEIKEATLPPMLYSNFEWSRLRMTLCNECASHEYTTGYDVDEDGEYAIVRFETAPSMFRLSEFLLERFKAKDAAKRPVAKTMVQAVELSITSWCEIFSAIELIREKQGISLTVGEFITQLLKERKQYNAALSSLVGPL